MNTCIPYLKIFVVGLLLSACSIDKKPYDSLTTEELNESEGSVEAATLGNYHRLKRWSENGHRLFEFPSDNVALSGTTTDPLFFTYNYQRIPNSTLVETYWRDAYLAIVGANKVIEALEEGSSSSNDQLIAENLYIRALVHFQLVNIFGRPYNQGVGNLGVPLKLDADAFNHPPRATVGEIYDQVEQDLLRAVDLFAESKAHVYASMESCWALLSRLELYKENNQASIDYANQVIDGGSYSLLPTAQLASYSTLAPEENSETIFAVKFQENVDYPDNGWYTVGSMYANILGSGWGEMYVSRPYLELIRKYPEDNRNGFIMPMVINENVIWAIYVDDTYTYRWHEVTAEGDDYSYTESGQRYLLDKTANNRGGFEYSITINGVSKSVLIDRQLDVRNGFPKYYVLKSSGQEGQVHLWSPVISRLAEMYLNRAEAYAKLGDNTAALADVNLIRSRAGIPAVGLYTEANLDGKSVLAIVLEERQLELAWEGHRKIDVYRNGITMDRRYPGTHLAGNNPISEIVATDPAIVEYIPENQIFIHDSLVQNP